MAMILRKSRLRLTQAIYFGEPTSAAGTGTVTSVAQANGIAATPNPIVGAGTVGFGLLTTDHSLGNFNLDTRNSTRWFNVVAYGADPTGAGDSTASVQAAIVAAGIGGGTVYFPPGNYKIAGTLTVPNSLIFRGDAAFGDFDSKGSVIHFPNALDCFDITGITGGSVEFYNLSFNSVTGADATAGAVIHSDSAANFPLIVENCHFLHHFTAIQLNSQWMQGHITHCRFTGTPVGGQDIWIDNLVNQDQGGILISDNQFLTAGGLCHIRQTAGGGTFIRQNVFLGAHQHTILVDIPTGKVTSDLWIEGNQFEDNATVGHVSFLNDGGFNNIFIQDNEFTVVANVPYINVAPTANGVLAAGTITGNVFNLANYAVYFDPVGVGGANIWNVSGNLFNEQTVAAIRLPAVANHVQNLSVGPNMFVANIGAVYVAGTFDPTSMFGPGIFTKAGFNTTLPTREVDVLGTIRSRGIAAPAVSEANSGTIYFDSGLNKFRVSLNGGAYVDLVGSAGLTGAGVAGRLPYWTAATNLSDAAGIYVDAVNSRLGVKTPAPAAEVDVTGDINITAPVTGYRINGNPALRVGNSSVIVGSTTSDVTAPNSTVVGQDSGKAITTGTRNTAVGYSSLSSVTINSQNTAMGWSALSATTGPRNTGFGVSSGATNTTGSNNVFLGQEADASAGNLTNAVAIGYQASVAANDSMVLGNGSMNVGIRTSTPVLPLDVNGAIGTRHHDVALVNGLNSDVVPTLTSWIRVTGPTAPFSIGGFTSGVDGRIMFIRNTVAFQMTINHLDGGSGATNQIVTPTAAPINCSVATLIYEDASDLWYVLSFA